jgi:DNA repair protein RadC
MPARILSFKPFLLVSFQVFEPGAVLHNQILKTMESTQQLNWIASEIKLVYKSKVDPTHRPKIGGSSDAVQVLRLHWDKSIIELCEQFKILLLNRANRVLGVVEISTGGIAGTVADPKLIFGAAVKAAACGIILAHNHPSGNCSASANDLDLTKKIKEGGKLLDISVLDHVILTREKYFSFADEGLM